MRFPEIRNRKQTDSGLVFVSPNKIMSSKSHDERKAGSLNLPVCSVSSSAHMTDLHLGFQSLATLHALPQILNRLPQSPQARERKSFSKKVLSMFNDFPGVRPDIRLPRWYKNLPECPVECGGGVQSLFGQCLNVERVNSKGSSLIG